MDAAATAFVGLGSNIDDPRAQVARAIRELDAIAGCELVGASRLYQSPPMGPPDQPDFVNAVARVRTTMPPRALLDALLELERRHGRVRGGAHWGPRALDLDLLLYDDLVLDEAGLDLPHPGLTSRPFVLYPLAELAPDLELPGAGPIRALLARVPAEGLVVIGD
jgi:2-amino-4-hydroxy-6-hydroxymethyldihydropteridine diphosphokinase